MAPELRLLGSYFAPKLHQARQTTQLFQTILFIFSDMSGVNTNHSLTQIFWALIKKYKPQAPPEKTENPLSIDSRKQL